MIGLSTLHSRERIHDLALVGATTTALRWTTVSSPTAIASRFSYDDFVRSDDRAQLCADLARDLKQRICSAEDPAAAGHDVAIELRQLGHDLWSYAESADLQEWYGVSSTDGDRHHELFISITFGDEPHPKGAGSPGGSLACTVDVVFQPRRRAPSKDRP